MKDNSAIKTLVLDDDSFMLKLLARMLANNGFTSVTTCDSGHAALKLFDNAADPPDLILADLNMPQMDGVEFVRRLADIGYAGSLILVSGEDERVLQTVKKLVQAHHINVLGYLQKPVSPTGLSRLLETFAAPRHDKAMPAARKEYSAAEIGAAIAQGQLVNYYQPKVAIATGEVVGVETLVRWRHPVDGLVFPDQFIGVAETSGLIDALTRQVLTDALAQTRAWHLTGLPLRVAVNVSMDNLTSLPFAEFVVQQTAASGVSPEHLVLEVTESRLMQDMRAPLEILTRLRLKRFCVSIDDFGTGHSSLSQLLDIPFDELKIDQSFVHRAWADETLRMIFNASLGLAQQLHMKVVAEGVEDRQDWDFLRRTACDVAQGYFIARPMPAAELPGWIRLWKGRTKDLLTSTSGAVRTAMAA